MISIILSWVYITLIVYCIGNSFHDLLKKVCRIENSGGEHFALVCISGLLLVTFFSTLLCLFMPLGLLSNLIILLLALLSAFFNRKNLRRDILFQWHTLKTTPLLLVILFLAFLLISGFFSYLPSSHHDDGLYYSTSIKWLQEYGTVKGLAMVNPRIAFNSAWLIVQANFGFQFLHTGLFNDLNGLLYLYFFLYFLQAVKRLWVRDRSLSNLLQALFFLPLLILYTAPSSDFLVYNSNMISSSSADLPTCMLVSLVCILFLKSGEDIQNGINLKALLLAFYSFMLISIKLSAVPVLLFFIIVVLRLVRIKKTKLAMILLFAFPALLIPWIVRNIYLSGYVLFPFSGLDIFQVDWKAPMDMVKYYEFSTKVYPIDPALILQPPHPIPLSTWIIWFKRMPYIHRVLLIQTTIATLVFLLIGGWQLLRRNFIFFRKQAYPACLIIIALTGILFWLLKGPDFRFGFGFIGIYCSLSLALFLQFFLESRTRWVSLIIVSFSLCALVVYWNKFELSIINSVFKRPQHYRLPEEISEVPIGNGNHMHLVTHDDSWNAPLPVANKNDFYYWKPALRGALFKDGFRQAH